MQVFIQNPKQFINVTVANLKTFLGMELTHRTQILSWVVADIFQPLILGAVWTTVARNSNSGLSVNQMVTYFFMVAIVIKISRDFSDQYVSNKIIYGEFSKYLLKPYNYLSEVLGISLASKLLRIVILVPFLIISYFFVAKYLEFDASVFNIITFFISLVIAFMINFMLGNTFALVAFFVKQILGLRSFYENTVSFLSGELIPIIAMPIGAATLVKVLPFRYSLSFPIEIITGQLTRDEIIRGGLVAIIWLAALMINYRLFYRYAVSKYEAEGI